MPITGFEDLAVWRRAKQLSVEIHRVTSSGKFDRDFGCASRSGPRRYP